MAGSLAKDAHIRVAFSAAANIRHLLLSLDTDPFFTEVLKSADQVLKDIDHSNSFRAQKNHSVLNFTALNRPWTIHPTENASDRCAHPTLH